VGTELINENHVIKVAFDKKLSTKITKKQALGMLCSSNYLHVEQAAQQHSGISDVAYRLAKYIGNQLPYGEVNLLDYILSDALTAWESFYEEHGARAAYHAYCLTIKELLPLVFNYRVRSKKRLMPYNASIWNCVSDNIYEWVSQCQVNEVEIEIGQVDSRLTQSEMSLLVSHNVFSRIDMMQWGLPPEGVFGVIQGKNSMVRT
jgi:hypothetical protein